MKQSQLMLKSIVNFCLPARKMNCPGVFLEPWL